MDPKNIYKCGLRIAEMMLINITSLYVHFFFLQLDYDIYENNYSVRNFSSLNFYSILTFLYRKKLSSHTISSFVTNSIRAPSHQALWNKLKTRKPFLVSLDCVLVVTYHIGDLGKTSMDDIYKTQWLKWFNWRELWVISCHAILRRRPMTEDW